MFDVIENLSHLVHPNGTKIQVLNSDGSEWDESATATAYSAYDNSIN